ncbi:mating-type protein MAT alpha 1 HMG-box domain-containing protein [Penicillium chermesinum]|uniref:Mating-type protein MAT alpha 1 HMG-box domain-containing protein n=1 Tax=Penicillium chermesinum TaxID=63820 RepID=A0A9W9NHA3_9EURO|nr:mating-type protein MAT alpha 1 HMG-box domain-containing protein [Penicillium chermesinum]KAJ5219862.1 mating-type protein MAT alpha 1 HMG-box domain-containing protein [Penicillium chermesinum]KAJ6157321.1 mating-type protein MAT alpha 1 HMG-box domain-containing protein [Penicillium chermesinum]
MSTQDQEQFPFSWVNVDSSANSVPDNSDVLLEHYLSTLDDDAKSDLLDLQENSIGVPKDFRRVVLATILPSWFEEIIDNPTTSPVLRTAALAYLKQSADVEVSAKKVSLNGFMAFRTFVMAAFAGAKQRDISQLAGMCWHEDPYIGTWDIIARAYNIVRNESFDQQADIPVSLYLGWLVSFIFNFPADPRVYLRMNGIEVVESRFQGKIEYHVVTGFSVTLVRPVVPVTMARLVFYIQTMAYGQGEAGTRPLTVTNGQQPAWIVEPGSLPPALQANGLTLGQLDQTEEGDDPDDPAEVEEPHLDPWIERMTTVVNQRLKDDKDTRQAPFTAV